MDVKRGEKTYLEILENLFFGERQEIAGLDSCGVEEYTTESSEFLGLLKDGLEFSCVGDVYAPGLHFDCLVG